MSAPLPNPRPYLFGDDDTTTVFLGEFVGDGLVAGREFFSEPEILRKLNLEQRADYKQARREGFHPVLTLDLETGVTALEMRKHS
jgi:hypothetical protein